MMDSGPSSTHPSTRITIACERCRVRKIRCNGRQPCDNCSEINADCIFRLTRSNRRSYPRGYAEMLEEQQGQMVNGLRSLYRRSVGGEGWPGAALLPGADGQPLTHDLLSRLGVLDQNRDRDDIRTWQDATSNQTVARSPNEPGSEGSSDILSNRDLRHASFPFDHRTFASVHSTMVGQPSQPQFLAQLSSAPPTSYPPSLTYDMTADPQSLQAVSSYTTALGQHMPGAAPEWIMNITDDDEVLHFPPSRPPHDT